MQIPSRSRHSTLNIYLPDVIIHDAKELTADQWFEEHKKRLLLKYQHTEAVMWNMRVDTFWGAVAEFEGMTEAQVKKRFHNNKDYAIDCIIEGYDGSEDSFYTHAINRYTECRSK